MTGPVSVPPGGRHPSSRCGSHTPTRPISAAASFYDHYIAASITLKRGLTGAKPEAFCRWVLDLLGYRPGVDTLDDLFPGTGVMARVIVSTAGELPLTVECAS